MRIAVIGAGGVGAGFGAALAKAGGDVTFVARGAHLAAMRENGLRVEGDRGETLVQPCRATDDPASIGPVASCCSASSCGTWSARARRSVR